MCTTLDSGTYLKYQFCALENSILCHNKKLYCSNKAIYISQTSRFLAPNRCGIHPTGTLNPILLCHVSINQNNVFSKVNLFCIACLVKPHSWQGEHKAKSRNRTEILCPGPEVLLLLAKLFWRCKTKPLNNDWES